jgi:photosystem II stability/assembly factor-like uncharacterized protein
MWQRLLAPIRRGGVRFQRAYFWHRVRYVVVAALILLLIADAVGIVMNTTPAVAKWETQAGTGLPASAPFDIQTLAVAPDGQTLLAGSYGNGIFRSTDNGRSWHPSSRGLTNLTIQRLLPTATRHIFAATRSGIFHSDDEGQSWQPANTGLPSLEAQGLVADTNGPSVYVAVTGAGVFRTTDAGESWQARSTGLKSLMVQSLIVGAEGKTLLAATADGSIWQSGDEGQSWDVVSQVPVPSGASMNAIYRAGERLFAALGGKGLQRSDDGGQTWVVSDQGLHDLYVRVLVADPAGPDLFVGTDRGIFRSTDDGRTWNLAGKANLIIEAIVAGPDHHTLFVGTPSGIFRSDDGGTSWLASSEGLTGVNVTTVVAGADSNYVFAGTSGGGVFRSDDRGQTWHPVNTGLASLFIQTLVSGPDRQSLFVATAEGIFHSIDAGTSWQPANQGLPDEAIQALAVSGGTGVSPGSGQQPSGTSVQASVFAGGPHGVFRFDEASESWQSAGEGLGRLNVWTLAQGVDANTLFVGGLLSENPLALPQRFNRLYPLTHNTPPAFQGGGVFRSDDGGQSWHPVNQGLSNLAVQALALDPNGKRLFAGTLGGGVFRSDDAGESWHPINKGLTTHVILSLLADNGVLYVGTDGGGVFRSIDGESWAPSNTKLGYFRVQSLTADAAGVYAATIGGVYRSAPGDEWVSASTGITALPVQAMAVAADGSPYIGTATGVFRLTTDGRWDAITTGLPDSSVTHLVAGKDILYAATPQGVFRLADARQWEPLNAGLSNFDSLSLATDGAGALYVWTVDGAFRLDGARWTRINSTFTDSSGPLEIGAKDGAIYLCVCSHPIFPQNLLAPGGYQLDEQGSLQLLNAWDSVFSYDGQGQAHSAIKSNAVRWVYTYTDDRLSQLVSSGFTATVTYDDNRHTIIARDPQGKVLVTNNYDDHDALISITDAGGQLSWSRVQQTGSPAYALRPDSTSIHQMSLMELPPDGTRLKGLGSSTDRAGLWTQIDRQLFLSRDGTSWLSAADLGWAGAFPSIQSVQIRDGDVLLHAVAGTTILRAVVPHPSLWAAPLTYLLLVTKTQLALIWAGDHAQAIATMLGLSLLLIVAYAYFAVMRPNKLHLPTMLWLLPRPRHLVAAMTYRSYAGRWAAADPVSRLILLEAAPDTALTVNQLETRLYPMGTAFSRESLQTALATLTGHGLLARDEGGWRPTEALLARVHRHELPADAVVRLAEQTRRDHPLYREAQRFLTAAGFTVRHADRFGFLCTSDLPLWNGVAPLYVWPVLERPLDLAEFQALCAATATTFNDDGRGHTVAVVIDQPPQASDLYQIFALRAQRGLTIVPLPQSLMVQANLDGREIEALKEQIDLYAGHADLYDVRSAVSDVLSFFGRSALLADLHRRVTSGGSVAVYGVRKIGKSSLLSRLREESEWLTALVDLEGYDQGLGYVYGEALHGWQLAWKARFPDQTWPLDRDPITSIDAAERAHAFRQAVAALLDALAIQPGRPGLLLFLDEMDVLFQQPEYLEFAGVLRGVAEDPRWRGRFAVLAAGLEPGLNRIDRMNGARNPFFTFFGEMPLGPLAVEDARTMVKSLGSQMGVSYTEEAASLLATAGGGHPLLTRQLCSQVIQGRERPITIEASEAEQAVDRYLRFARNYLAESLWGIDSGGPPPAEAAILKALATQQPQLDGALMPVTISPEEARARHLAIDHLADQSLIRHSGGGWEFTIPLYRRWIRYYILHLPLADLVETAV